MKGFLRVVLINAAVLAAVLLVLFVLLEVGGNIYLMRFASGEVFRTYASHRQLEAQDVQMYHAPREHEPHRYIGFVPKRDYRYEDNRHNSHGFRGDEIVVPKPEGEFRIACLGGSTTYTVGAKDWRESYPAQLERSLRDRGYNVSVVNAGCLNYLTYATLINLQFRVMDIEPDMIIVYQAINDLMGRLIWPPSAYTGDNSGMKLPLASGWFMPPVWEHSTVIRFLLIRTGRAVPHSAGFGTLNRLAPSYKGNMFLGQWADGTYPDGFFAEHPVADLLEANPPIHFRRNMLDMANVAKGHGVVPVFASFAYSPHFPEYPWSTNPELQAGYVEMNDVTRQVCEETGAVFYDYASEFPQDAEYYYDGIHLIPEGARLKAEHFADFLTGNQLIPPEFAVAPEP